MSTKTTTIDPERQMLGEVEVIGRDRWEEIRRRAGEGASIRAIARALDLDRKTVRRCLRQTEWKPYQRAARSDTLLTTHAEYLRGRAAEVGYSAQVLFQELRGRQYRGSYETVKRFVRPLRETQLHAAVTRTRFETPPGLHYVDTRVMLREADQGRLLAADGHLGLYIIPTGTRAIRGGPWGVGEAWVRRGWGCRHGPGRLVSLRGRSVRRPPWISRRHGPGSP